MHPWDMNEEEARMLQEELAEDCILDGEPEVELVAGLDVSFYPDSRICIASAVSYSLTNRRVYEQVVKISELNFPYISGLLAFREAPPMIEAAMCLKARPDCFLVDGHGYAHPRRMGLASHIGLFLDTPTIGCAKNILVGEYDEPAEQTGASTQIWDGEPVGYAVRSMEGADPIFLSPGHMISNEYVPKVVEPLFTENSRLPEPLRLADRTAGTERSKIEDLVKPFTEQEIGVFLLGGTVRDLLTGKQPDDYDLMVTNFDNEIRTELEDEFGGSWFTLDEERQMYRLPGEKVQVDVTVVGEQEVVEDLERRDFTINSIALDMVRESWVDPVDGRHDAEQRILRLTSNNSLDEDPLRLLRAYRLAADHNLIFADELQQKIGATVGRLQDVSRERITDELLRLSDRPDSGDWFQKMYDDGLISGCPYFRSEAIEEIRLIEHWRPALKNYPTLNARDYHGGYETMTCFKTARLIRQEELDSWPLHRQIKQLARGSYSGMEAKTPDLPILKSNHFNLMGRLFGRGLWERWERDRMLRAIIELEEFIEKREQEEREIVEEHREEGNIGEAKEQRFAEILPQYWEQTVGKL